jgi:hypothetical protein
MLKTRKLKKKDIENMLIDVAVLEALERIEQGKLTYHSYLLQTMDEELKRIQSKKIIDNDYNTYAYNKKLEFNLNKLIAEVEKITSTTLLKDYEKLNQYRVI